MAFSPDLAAIRFGCGLSPSVAPPQSVADMRAMLAGPDLMAAAYPIELMSDFRARMVEMKRRHRVLRGAKGTPQEQQRFQEIRDLVRAARLDREGWLRQTVQRRARTPDGLRERLVFFWSDHFTARGRSGLLKRANAPYVEAAIRPNVTGRFEDMLIAVTQQPLMLHYLSQSNSVGPNSRHALRSKKPRGLNENLAREILELHTLGVEGPYTQKDVREFAELLTGFTFKSDEGFRYAKMFAEPGAETVLGVAYGGEEPELAPVIEALRDLARHPATARHLAGKMAVHFVADTPDPALVAAIEAAYLDTGGDLEAMVAAMLDHPAAWVPDLGNAKLPLDFVTSAVRALDVPPATIDALNSRETRALFLSPMTHMGQPWQQPLGPDGWPEADAHWITPQGLAMRIAWSAEVPQRLRTTLPDPRAFVDQALGTLAPEKVRFAAGAAESRDEAVAIVLSSPAFQRR